MRKPVALALVGLALVACDPDYVVHHVGWFATMRHQRSIKPYAMPRNPVPGTIPVPRGLDSLLPALTVGEVDSLTLAGADRVTNPRSRTSESINRGKWVYETYCLVCHGSAGRGDGPISSSAGGPFFGVRSLVNDTIARRSDGYIYGVVLRAQTMGRGLMPIYGDKIHGTDRWDVVNYVRFLRQQVRAGGSR